MRTFWQGCRRPADPAGLLVARPWLGTSPGATSLSTLGCRCRRPACRMALAEDKPQRYISLDSRLSVSPARLPHGPGWGQAPALQPPLPTPLDSGFRRNDEWEGIPTDAGMTRPTVVAGTIHPGSESGTCFRTNRPCRLPPAHQGMKSRSCGLVQRIGTADSATPHPDPSGGQAPALHLLIPPSAIGLQFGTFRRWRAGIKVD